MSTNYKPAALLPLSNRAVRHLREAGYAARDGSVHDMRAALRRAARELGTDELSRDLESVFLRLSES